MSFGVGMDRSSDGLYVLHGHSQNRQLIQLPGHGVAHRNHRRQLGYVGVHLVPAALLYLAVVLSGNDEGIVVREISQCQLTRKCAWLCSKSVLTKSIMSMAMKTDSGEQEAAGKTHYLQKSRLHSKMLSFVTTLKAAVSCLT